MAALEEIAPVVLLDTGLRPDNHGELSARQAKRDLSIAPHVTPATNLEVQTQVLSRALAFVGTYGGTSYVASACGIPTFTLRRKPGNPRKLRHGDALRPLAAHITLSEHLASTIPGFGPIARLEIDDPGVVKRLLETLSGHLTGCSRVGR